MCHEYKLIVDNLALASFILNRNSQQTSQRLGVILDVLTGRYLVPEEKIVKVMHSIDSVLTTWLVPAHLWLV